MRLILLFVKHLFCTFARDVFCETTDSSIATHDAVSTEQTVCQRGIIPSVIYPTLCYRLREWDLGVIFMYATSLRFDILAAVLVAGWTWRTANGQQ